MASRTTRLCRAAFTLVEMLTVLGILAIVIAIIIPVMGKARNAARNADTRTTLNTLGQAIASFNTDQRRLPGYFNAKLMGDPVNASTYGWDGCGNLMLDLIGGITTQAQNVSAGIITVGPGNGAQSQVNVDLHALGATTQSKSGVVNRGYYTMDTKRFVAQNQPGQRFGGNDNALFPSLIDNFGQPILAWVSDEGANSSAAMSAIDASNANAPNGARFYWASNAAFLNNGPNGVTALGRIGASQVYTNINRSGSLLSPANNNTAPGDPRNARVVTMDALLGNPASPSEPPAPIVPLAARGPIVLHSAGVDGVFLNGQDVGGRPGYVQYRANQDAFGGGLFDDIVYAAGH